MYQSDSNMLVNVRTRIKSDFRVSIWMLQPEDYAATIWVTVVDSRRRFYDVVEPTERSMILITHVCFMVTSCIGGAGCFPVCLLYDFRSRIYLYVLLYLL